MTRFRRHFSPPSATAATIVISLLTAPLLAKDGSNDVFVTVPTGETLGWKTFEILSAGDTLATIAQEGFAWNASHNRFDGLGAHRPVGNTIRVFLNHESGANSTFSRIDLNQENLRTWVANGVQNNTNSNQVGAPGQIVTAVSQGWLTLGSGSNPINRPCSGNVWPADTFGPGRGFADTLYLTAEESSGGHFWVMDTSTRTLYEAVDLGANPWENACIIDAGRTDTVALILSADAGSASAGTAPLHLYVGQKTPGGNFLQRNGLSGGTVYFWNPSGTGTNGTMSGIFSGGNGAQVTGTWTASSTGAALFSKSEDVHSNTNPASPRFGVEAALASQGEAVFLIDCSQLSFVAGSLGTNRDSAITVFFQAGTQAGSNGFAGMDNLVWSPDGNIYVNEDDGEGDIWKIDVDSLLASYAENDFTPDANQVFDILDSDFVSESSGIIDVSHLLEYEPGSVFFTAGQSGTLSDNQLAMVVSPNAALLSYTLTFSASIGGSITGASPQTVTAGSDGTTVTAVPDPGYGFITWTDGVMTASRTDTDVSADINVTAAFEVIDPYLVWISGFPSLTGGDTLGAADPDFDNRRNSIEFALGSDPDVFDAAAPLTVNTSEGAITVSFDIGQPLSTVIYTLEFSEDLTDWSNTEVVTESDIDPNRVAAIEKPLPASGKLFVRLRVDFL